jgi:geranylgeranyl diphosphate synthase, type I
MSKSSQTHYQSMPLSELEKLCFPAIEKKLGAFLEKMEARGLKWNVAMGRYHFSTGGKRLRAFIPCWIFSCYGRDPLEALPLGCAIELAHNATLVHDDLQDGDVTRRGKETVWKKYGDAQAINCGDALFFFALEMLEEFDVPPAIWKSIASRLSQGILRVIEGQAQEFLMNKEPFPVWDRYLEVVSGKTAALFSAAVISSLEAVGETPETLAWAENTAMRSGILFQIQDDILDIYGDKQRERRGSDIAEGKISALVAAYNEQADLDERTALASVLSAARETVTDAQIADVVKQFEARGIKETVLQRLEEFRILKPAPSTCRAGAEMTAFFREINNRFLAPIQNIYPINRAATQGSFIEIAREREGNGN